MAESKPVKRLNPARYIVLLSVSIKLLCLIALLLYWQLLAETGWFRWFVALLLTVFIGVQGRRLWRIWR